MKVCFVTDRKLSAGRDIFAVVSDAVASGMDMIQVREKDLSGKALLEFARRVVEISKGTRCEVFVNGRFDVALAAGASGVHLGYDSIPPEAVRKVVGEKLKIGISIHTLEEAGHAHSSGADLAIMGPVFRTPSKEGILEPLGVGRLREAAALCRIPLYAIGGIDGESIGLLAGCGAEGVAMIRAIMEASSMKELKELIERIRKIK